MEQGRFRKGHKKGREKTVRILRERGCMESAEIAERTMHSAEGGKKPYHHINETRYVNNTPDLSIFTGQQL
jgi:hypothetical protein